MLVGWLRNRYGGAGLLAAAMVWGLSAVALALAMQANLAASGQMHIHRVDAAERLVRQLHLAAIVWSVGFTTLQLASFLTFTLVLRASYHLRTAVCFALGAGIVMLGDGLGLFVVLLWLRVTLGA